MGCSEVHGLCASDLRALKQGRPALACSDGAVVAVFLWCKCFSRHGQLRGLSKKCGEHPIASHPTHHGQPVAYPERKAYTSSRSHGTQSQVIGPHGALGEWFS